MTLEKLNRNCPICQGDEGEKLLELTFTLPEDCVLPAKNNIVACHQCQFVFTYNGADQADYDQYYSQFSKYEHTDIPGTGGDTEDDRERFQKLITFLSEQKISKEAKVFDLGAASGGLLNKFREEGFTDLTGLDPSDGCVETMKKAGHKAHVGTVYNLNTSGQYDLVILSHVMEHVFDLQQAMGSIAKVIKPGGYLYIEIPDSERYCDYINSPLQDFNLEHINHFSSFSLGKLTRLFNFQKSAELVRELSVGPRSSTPVYGGLYQKQAAPAVLSKIKQYIDQSQGYLDELSSFIEKEIDTDEVIVWGSGQLFYKLLGLDSMKKKKIIKIVDNNSINWGKSIEGIAICSPKELVGTTQPILITTTIHSPGIIENIKSLGVNNSYFVLPDMK